MVSGIVLNQFPGCFFEGSIQLYTDEYLQTTPIYDEVIGVNGEYEIPNTINFYNIPVFVVIRNNDGDILYKTQFLFYSYINGDPIDYENLNFRIRDIKQTSCNLSEEETIFCGFYVIKEPCSSRVCVYNTQTSDYTDIWWTFGEYGNKDRKHYGQVACYLYQGFGQFKITQNVFKIEGQEAYGCCGILIPSQQIVAEVECEQIIQIERFIPEVQFETLPIDPCCDTDCLSPDKPYCIRPLDRITFRPFITAHNQWCCSEFGTDCTEETTVTFDRELQFFDPSSTIGQQDPLYLYEDGFFEYYSLCIDFTINAPCCGDDLIKFTFEVFNRNPNIVIQSIKDQVTGEQYIPNVEYSLPGGVSVDLKFCYTFGTRKELQEVEDGVFTELKVNVFTCNKNISESFLLNLDGEGNVITETAKLINCEYTGNADFYPFPLDISPINDTFKKQSLLYNDDEVTPFPGPPIVSVTIYCAGVPVIESGPLLFIVEPAGNYLGTLQNIEFTLNNFLASYNLETYITNYINQNSLLIRYINPSQPITGVNCACNKLKIEIVYTATIAGLSSIQYNSVCCKEITESTSCDYEITFNSHISVCPARFEPFPLSYNCNVGSTESQRFIIPYFRLEEYYALRFVLATYSEIPECQNEWGGPTSPKVYADFTYLVNAGFAGREDAPDYWVFHEDFVTLLNNAVQNNSKYVVTGLAYEDIIDPSYHRVKPSGIVLRNRVRALRVTFNATECQRLRDCEVVMYAYTEWVDDPTTQIPPIAVNTLKTKFIN